MENLWLMNGDCLERMKEIPDGRVENSLVLKKTKSILKLPRTVLPRRRLKKIRCSLPVS